MNQRTRSLLNVTGALGGAIFLLVSFFVLIALDMFVSWLCPCINYCTGCWPASACSYAGIYVTVLFIIVVLGIITALKKREGKK